MALIFSPITEDVLEGPFQPLPKSVFVIAHLGKGISQIESEMRTAVRGALSAAQCQSQDAASIKGNKDYLAKIIQTIRGCGFAVAIFSEYTPAPTMGNIFFEVALCNLFGKPVILVKTEEAKAPSDFVRSEWVAYKDGDTKRLTQEVQASVMQVLDLANYYEKLGDIAHEADEGDLELAFERYKQAMLISGRASIKKKINEILETLRSEKPYRAGMMASTARLRKSVGEFAKLLP